MDAITCPCWDSGIQKSIHVDERGPWPVTLYMMTFDTRSRYLGHALVTIYDVIDLDQYRFRSWHVTWQQQFIIWYHIDQYTIRFCGIMYRDQSWYAPSLSLAGHIPGLIPAYDGDFLGYAQNNHRWTVFNNHIFHIQSIPPEANELISD